MLWHKTSLRAGTLAGLLAGCVGALYQLLVTERILTRATDLEGHLRDHDHGDPLVSRAFQQVGGAVTTIVVGTLFGLFFVGLLHLASRRVSSDRLAAALTLSGLCFVAFGLVPALLTPASPPGAGDPQSVGERTTVYFMVLVLGALWMVGTMALPKTFARSSRLRHHVLPATVAVSALAVVLLLVLAPGLEGAVAHHFPADLLWDFRVASLGQILVMAVTLPLAWSVLSQEKPRERHRAATRV